MKRILYVIACLLIGMTAMAATSNVRINLKSGDKVVVGFDAKPEIAMLSNGIQLTATGLTAATYEFDDVDSIDFPDENEDDGPHSAIDSYDADALYVANLADRIEFRNVPAADVIRLIALDGKVVYTGSAENGQATISKADYAHGVYIVTVGSKSFKVTF